jgi:hypothetical protein
MRSTFLLLFAALLVLPACAQEAETPAPSSSQQARQQGSTESADQDFDPDKERATKEQFQEQAANKQVIRKAISEIDWSQAKTFEQADFAGLDEQQRARLVDAPVPALVPDVAELHASATATTGEHWYALSLDGDQHSVYVSGTRHVTVVEGLELVDEQPDLEDDFRMTRTDGIVSLAVNAFGAAYTIEVECARPGTDERCIEDDYVVSLANALAVPKGQVHSKSRSLKGGQ